MWRGRLSPRRASVLARHLPAGAMTWQAGGYDSAWTVGEHLTATVIDALQVGNWQRGGDSKAKRPTPVQRPSDARRSGERAERMDARARAFLERQKRAQAATTT